MTHLFVYLINCDNFINNWTKISQSIQELYSDFSISVKSCDNLALSFTCHSKKTVILEVGMAGAMNVALQ